MTSLQCSLVVYDIPAYRGIANPSPVFRKIGFRLNKSVWVVPTHLIPWETLHDLQRQGSQCGDVKFDVTEAAAIQAMAIEALSRELAEARESLETTTAASEARLTRELAGAFTQPEVETAERAHWGRIRHQVYMCQKLTDDLHAASNVFGVSLGNSLRETRQLAEGIKGRAWSRASAFVRARRTLAHLYPEMAAALQSGDAPPAIAADVLEENGECEDAAALRESFRE